MTPRPLLLGLLLLVGACASNKGKGEEMGAGTAEVACICGTPEAAFEGCPHALCIRGERNPENPECVCGPLTLGEDGLGEDEMEE